MDRLISEKYLIEHLKACFENGRPMYRPTLDEVLEMIKAIPSAEPRYYPPCEDCNTKMNEIRKAYDKISSAETKKCKNCKWWRDSDGVYRRGVKAESKCPINTVSVANGWGYCYMFEPQESEDI